MEIFHSYVSSPEGRKRDLSKMIFFQVNDCDSERFSIRGLVPKEQGETTKALSHIQKGCPPKSSSMFLIEMDIF